MKTWAFVLGAAVAAGAAAVVVTLALRRVVEETTREEIPTLIDDCFERVHRIEAELHRLSPALQQAD